MAESYFRVPQLPLGLWVERTVAAAAGPATVAGMLWFWGGGAVTTGSAAATATIFRQQIHASMRYGSRPMEAV